MNLWYVVGFPGPGIAPTTYQRSATAELDVSDEREVARYRETADRWKQAAAPGPDAADLLDRIRRNLG